MSEADFEQAIRLLREVEERKRRLITGEVDSSIKPSTVKVSAPAEAFIRRLALKESQLIVAGKTITDLKNQLATVQDSQFIALCSILADLRNEVKAFRQQLIDGQKQHRDRVTLTLDKLDDTLD